jgi:hypothetical protein
MNREGENQVSPLAEHKVTRLLHLVIAIAERLDLPQAHDPHLSELAQDVQPEQVLDKLEEEERQTALLHAGEQ